MEKIITIYKIILVGFLYNDFMRKNDGWLNALFALIFIAIPALIGYYFLLPDWTNAWIISYGFMWGLAIAFVCYVIILTITLIYFKIAAYDSINFNIPIAIIFAAIFVTVGFPIWARTLIIIFLIFLAFPINMLTTKLKYKAQIKIMKKRH